MYLYCLIKVYCETTQLLKSSAFLKSCVTRFFSFFFISHTFISNARLKLAKNQEVAKQHPKAELLLFQNNSHSPYTLSTKNNGTYSKK